MMRFAWIAAAAALVASGPAAAVEVGFSFEGVGQFMTQYASLGIPAGGSFSGRLRYTFYAEVDQAMIDGKYIDYSRGSSSEEGSFSYRVVGGLTSLSLSYLVSSIRQVENINGSALFTDAGDNFPLELTDQAASGSFQLFSGFAGLGGQSASFTIDRVRSAVGGGGLQLLDPVPEPASWALMIGGFGLVGGALRSRRAKVIATVAFT